LSRDPALRHFSDGDSEEVPARPRTRTELLREAALAVPHLTVLLSRLMRDPDVPRKRKWFAAGALGYLAFPYDVLPDRIPFIGRIDDVVVVAAAVHYLMRSVPPEKLNEYWEGSEDALDIVGGLIQWAADLIPGPLKNVLAM
jgi:uncharacterized membrane protein YkvA (DUF1232 family)